MKALLPYLKPFRKQCIIGPLCKWIEAILELILPTIMAFMINEGVMQHDQQVVIACGALMVLMVFIGFGFSLVCQYNAAIASQGFGTNMRNLLFAHIMKLSYEDLDEFSHSTLFTRISSDVNQLQLAVAMLIRLVIRSPFIVIGAVIMAMLLDMRLALILIACVPLIALVLTLYIKYTTPLYQAYQTKLDRFLSILEQNLSGVRVIRAFLSQRHASKQLEEAAYDLQKQMLHVSRLSALLNPITALIINGAIVILLWNGMLSLPDAIPAGTLIAFINYATQILLALVAVSNLIVIFSKAQASAERVNELLATEIKQESGTLNTVPDQQTAIQCEHMSFTYKKAANPSLNDITLQIISGQSIGIIGGTGSGKSTLAAVWMNLYPCEGIRLFGAAPAQYDTRLLNELITLIPQTSELFSGTLRDNLMQGNSDASDSELWKALNDAQAIDFVKQKGKGLEFPIEAGGKNLSGGQRQRIAIARGLLRNTKITVFDDSFSALDYETDAKLREALNSYTDMTKIIISQRVATLYRCDKILVLDNGNAVGFDTHENLCDSCLVYREICHSQQFGKEGAL